MYVQLRSHYNYNDCGNIVILSIFLKESSKIIIKYLNVCYLKMVMNNIFIFDASYHTLMT